MNNYVIKMQKILFNRLRAETPIDTGNMLANIVHSQSGANEASITISAPMQSRSGVSRRTGKYIEAPEKSDYDYARDVNYSRKSPHRFWVEQQIKEAVHIVCSNANYGL